MSTASFFKCLGDETRLRCLMLLQAHEALCVCDIAQALELSQPKVSRHLAQLRGCNLVSDHRKGQWVYYRLHPDLCPWQRKVLSAAHGTLADEAPFCCDLRRLEQLEKEQIGNRCP